MIFEAFALTENPQTIGARPAGGNSRPVPPGI